MKGDYSDGLKQLVGRCKHSLILWPSPSHFIHPPPLGLHLPSLPLSFLPSSLPPSSLPSFIIFLPPLTCAQIEDMLQKDPKSRPSASEICNTRLPQLKKNFHWKDNPAIPSNDDTNTDIMTSAKCVCVTKLYSVKSLMEGSCCGFSFLMILLYTVYFCCSC